MKETNKLVALKKLLTDNEKEGFPITALREINILKALKKHENIIHLIEICTTKRKCFIQKKYDTSFNLIF
jgi:serine/threonine protein kinase